jgi:hypothetical protein
MTSHPEIKVPLLRKGIVIKVEKWPLPVQPRTQWVKRPTMDIDIQIQPDEIKNMPDKQFAAFEKSFEAAFQKEFWDKSKAWVKEVQTVIDILETDLLLMQKAGGDPKTLASKIEAKVKAAEQNLAKRNAGWVKWVTELTQRVYDPAVDASIKAMKQRIQRKKVKRVLKVVLFVSLALAGTAAAIAATVLTGGAGVALFLPLAIGIYKGAQVLVQSGKKLKDAANVLDPTLKDVKKTSNELKEYTMAAVKAQQSGSKLDATNAAWKRLGTSAKKLNDQLGQTDKFVTVYREKMKDRKKVIDDAKAKLDSVPKENVADRERLKKQLVLVEMKADKTEEVLRKLMSARKSGAEVLRFYNVAEPDKLLAEINGLLGKLPNPAEFGRVYEFIGSLAELADSAREIADHLSGGGGKG